MTYLLSFYLSLSLHIYIYISLSLFLFFFFDISHVKRIENTSTLRATRARIIAHTFVPGRWRITFPKKTPSNGESEAIDFPSAGRVGDVAGARTVEKILSDNKLIEISINLK